MEARLLTRPFVLVWVANFAQSMAFSLFLHFPGFLEEELAASEIQIGFIVGLAALASILVRPGVGRAMDRRGRRVVILGGNAVNVAVIGLYLTVTVIGPWLYTIRVVHGLAEAVLFTAFFTYAADEVPESRRTEGLALFGVSGMLTIALGGLLGDVILAVGTYDTFFLVALGFAAAALVVSLPLRDIPVGEGQAPARRFWSSFTQRNLLPLWFITFIFSFAVTAYFIFLKTFVLETGIGSVGLFFAFYAGTAVVLRLTAAWLPDRIGPKRVLYPALGALAVGFLVLAQATSDWEVAVAGTLTGAGHGYTFPILYGLTVTRARDRERGAAMAAFTGLFDLAILVAGPTLGWVIDRADYPAMFRASALTVVLGGLIFALWDRGGVTRRPEPVAPAPAVARARR